MSLKVNAILKNFSYAFISNLISMIVSIIIIIILPKLLGVAEYGYFQLFIFYSSYVGFLHLGWNDGIYLRYGGKYYNDLDYKVFNGQFITLLFSQFLISIIIITLTLFNSIENNRLFIIYMLSLVLIIINSRYMLIFILQTTNRIKEFALITIVEKIIYVLLILYFIIFDRIDFKLIIISDVIGKFISLILATYFCKEIVFNKFKSFQVNFYETKQNIIVGSKLMIANFASILIIGVVRFGIERAWDIVTFAKISLILSISNFLMIFINAIGIILFPLLKRFDKGKLQDVYIVIRDFMSCILIGILIFYFPLKVLLGIWLPEYKESLIYLSLIFAMVVYEGKTALLLNTYYKALRMEKVLLKVNFISLILSILLTFITTFVFKNLELAVLTILVLVAFKSILAEVLLSKFLNIYFLKNIFWELGMTFIFIIINWFVMNTFYSLSMYLIFYLIYLFINKQELVQSLKKVTKLIND